MSYYINHNTVILRIQKTGGTAYSRKIGINDLKYLVLLCLQGKTVKAIDAIYNYLYDMQDPAEVVKTGATGKLFKGLPEFILKQSGIEVQDRDKEKTARINYIREKWTKKKDESVEMELHRKGRDILRYINWHCKTPLGTEKYDQLLVLLVNKNFAGFGDELNEFKRTEIILKDIFEKLSGFQTINTLHQKVCNLVLEELSFFEKSNPEKLEEYIGLIRKPAPENNQPPKYKEKVKTFVEQPMIYKGFLRDQFFVNKDQDGKKLKEQKTFAKLVEETLGQNADVPLGKDFYYIPNIEKDERKNRFHKDNAALYETLALDRLCAMMARECFEHINENLHKNGKEMRWEKEGEKEFIYMSIDPEKLIAAPTNLQFEGVTRGVRCNFGDTLKIPLPKAEQKTFTIRFDRKDYSKLYVMDDAHFLSGLIRYFFPKAKEKPIDYHILYSDGINQYTELQRQGIMAIFALEEKIIREKNISTNRKYVPFSEIMKKSVYPFNEQRSLTQVRNALQHYQLGVKPKPKEDGSRVYYGFTPDDFRTFVAVMAREGICKKEEWNLRI